MDFARAENIMYLCVYMYNKNVKHIHIYIFISVECMHLTQPTLIKQQCKGLHQYKEKRTSVDIFTFVWDKGGQKRGKQDS